MKILAATAAIVLCAAAQAIALDEIYSPNVEYREMSLEYSGSRTFDKSPDKNNAQGHEFVLEAGLTPRFTGEISAGLSKNPDAPAKMEHVEAEGRYQFFEAGENWLDSGILVAYDFSTLKQQSDSVEVKLLLQKDVDKITSTANIGFNQGIGQYAQGGPDYVFLWNTRYRYSLGFQPGIEIQSDMGQDGTLRHFNQQEHYVGPAIYGKIFSHLKYQVAWLAGVSEASSQSAARALVEYEMHF